MNDRSALDQGGHLDVDELFAALFTEEARADPYRFLRRHSWAGSALPDGSAGDERPEIRTPAPPPAEQRFWRVFGKWVINLDGPEHEIVRSLVARPLAPPRGRA